MQRSFYCRLDIFGTERLAHTSTGSFLHLKLHSLSRTGSPYNTSPNPSPLRHHSRTTNRANENIIPSFISCCRYGRSPRITVNHVLAASNFIEHVIVSLFTTKVRLLRLGLQVPCSIVWSRLRVVELAASNQVVSQHHLLHRSITNSL
jgi:hypothetical protein